MKLIKKLNLSQEQYVYILAALVLVTAVFLTAWFLFFDWGRANGDQVLIDPTPDQKEEREKTCEHRRILDGVCVKLERYTNPDLVAVMIENSFEAWPLSGLSKASIVYEAPVEGGIPRFLALYTADAEVDELGPVRSARPYYLDWLSEYGDVMYMHVGGSPEALLQIDDYNLFDLNEFYRGKYYWRSNGRIRPHDVMTSSKLWGRARQDYAKYVEEENFEGWVFSDMELCEVGEGKCANEIVAKFLSPTYDARWEFNSSMKQYIRHQNKEKQFDADGSQIAADTVIVQRVTMATIDEIGRKRIDTIGHEEAIVFRDGHMIEGGWEKASRKDRTKFYDKDGNIIPLRPGKIWIEVLPLNTGLEVK